MKKEDLAVGGAIGASLLIGACCLGPALFLLFGVSIGALGILASLEPYRPFFVVLGGGTLPSAQLEGRVSARFICLRIRSLRWSPLTFRRGT